MNAQTIHVTCHARKRWQERVAEFGVEDVGDIVRAVRQSRVLRRDEPLPYPTPRMPGFVYTSLRDVMFVLKPVLVDEYRLVTVVASARGHAPKMPKLTSKEKRYLRGRR